MLDLLRSRGQADGPDSSRPRVRSGIKRRCPPTVSADEKTAARVAGGRGVAKHRFLRPPAATGRARAGQVATYDVRLTNPTNAAVTYDLFQPFGSFAIATVNNGQSHVTVAPGATVDVPLQVT